MSSSIAAACQAIIARATQDFVISFCGSICLPIVCQSDITVGVEFEVAGAQVSDTDTSESDLMAAERDDEIIAISRVVQVQAAGGGAQAQFVIIGVEVRNCIVAATGSVHEGIFADAAGQGIVAAAADERVVAATAVDGIVAGTAVDDVGAGVAGQIIVMQYCAILVAGTGGTDVGADDILEIIQYVSLGIVVLVIAHIGMVVATRLLCIITTPSPRVKLTARLSGERS